MKKTIWTNEMISLLNKRSNSELCLLFKVSCPVITAKRKELGILSLHSRIVHKFINKIEKKLCIHCKKWKAIDCYGACEKSKDKLKSRCKSCRNNLTEQQKIVNRKRASKWQKNNVLKVRARSRRIYLKNKNNIEFRLLQTIRARINRALKTNAKNTSSKELLGCSIHIYKKYLESMFDSNMTWDNYATYWQIDHIIPCTYFNLLNKEHIKKCFNYKNTQPLNKIENIRKSNFYFKK